MEPKRLALNFSQSLLLVDFLKQKPFSFNAKNGIVEAEGVKIILPFCFKQEEELPKVFSPNNYVSKTLFLLVQSGSAAIGYAENGTITHHKVIKKYMVRKKQGKAQLKHLNSKGKSRLGSRIRLQQADKFFNEIHEKIGEWKVLENTNVIYYSYAKSLIPFIYNQPDHPILKKDDARQVKLPFDLEEPNYKSLLHMNKTVHKSIVTISNENTWETFNNWYSKLDA